MVLIRFCRFPTMLYTVLVSFWLDIFLMQGSYLILEFVRVYMESNSSV